MRTSSLVFAAAGLLGISALAGAQSRQPDDAASTGASSMQRDSSQAQIRQMHPSQSSGGPTVEQESMRRSGSGMGGDMTMDSRPARGALRADSDLPPAVDGNEAIRVQQKTENGIAYLCGGVGVDEAGYMKQQAANYDLMLTFTTRAGNYLADVDVNLMDNRGNTVLQTTCDAPILLVNLPRGGVYRVQAQAGDYNLSRTVSVNPRGHRQVVMAWTQEPYLPELPTRSPRPQSVGGGGIGSDAGSGSMDDMSRPQTQSQ
jgi:hypothetical protein